MHVAYVCVRFLDNLAGKNLWVNNGSLCFPIFDAPSFTRESYSHAINPHLEFRCFGESVRERWALRAGGRG
jgi:hypothetical protein